MDRGVRLVRPFRDVAPRRKDYGGIVWRAINAETVGSRHLILSIFCTPKGSWAPIHSHTDDHIYLVLEGELIIECQDNEYLVQRHEVLYVPAGVKHRQKNNSREDAITVAVGLSLEGMSSMADLEKQYHPHDSL